MGPNPLTRQRSPWLEAESVMAGCRQFERRVSDGVLVALVAIEPEIGWHLSISYRSHSGQPRRYPSWDELAHARYELLPVDVDFVMHLPPPDEYVALHPTVFHLHQHPEPGP